MCANIVITRESLSLSRVKYVYILCINTLCMCVSMWFHRKHKPNTYTHTVEWLTLSRKHIESQLWPLNLNYNSWLSLNNVPERARGLSFFFLIFSILFAINDCYVNKIICIAPFYCHHHHQHHHHDGDEDDICDHVIYGQAHYHHHHRRHRSETANWEFNRSHTNTHILLCGKNKILLFTWYL